ncbi:FAD:protein FMN transferase [candidate division KSB3 bacterium]|uniref:FAD:protein FMN transferase n=1 Tax=candidate division KSB3 bacterium TaxID=2044937 RepID=A0A9D5JTL2_9BACT|nr:FAD:protein FMN transferase [candidate division KSB3 bacterium]MBD3323978.1 FAD:protein FMN transferase [candidate division KSB3 bacterium]
MKAGVLGLVLAGLVGGLVLSRGKSEPTIFRQSQFLLDTFVEIMVVASDEQDAQKAMAAAYTEMRRVEALTSRYQPESPLAHINQRAGSGQFTPVPDEVHDLLQRSVAYSVMTDGAFDPTVGALIEAWGIGTEQERVPAEAALQQLLPAIGSSHVELDNEQGVRLRDPQTRLDLGAIAKGYSVDRGIAVLQRHQMTNALVNAGGDIRCIGVKPDGMPWRVGIQHPRESEILGVLELQERAVATSGDYERYFMQEGVRYHHILVPQTGRPARGCQSVTILADTAEAADAFATAVFIMGPEHGLTFIEAQDEIEGLIISADGTLIPSSGFSLKAR